MPFPFYRPTVAKIDLDNLTHNIKLFQNRVNDTVNIMAVVKADAYGHGVLPIVKHLKSIGINFFAVAFLDEAIQIRKAGILDPILVLGYIPDYGVELAIMNDIILTLFSKESINYLDSVGKKINKEVRVHLKVDTGMGRIGTFPEDAYQIYNGIKNREWIQVEGIYTHFASADEANKSLTYKQIKRFREVVDKIKEDDNFPSIHLSNSAALIDLPDLEQNFARLGISLYGLLPSDEVSLTYKELKPVMSLETEIIYIKQIDKGSTVSYGATFKASRKTIVATLPIGYADGLSRKLSNKGYVLVKGKRVPIIGRVCMDQTMIDVTDIDKPNIGDKVIIFGQQDKEFISLDEHAKLTGTINYELATLIGKRVPRIYYKNSEVIEASNYLLE